MEVRKIRNRQTQRRRGTRRKGEAQAIRISEKGGHEGDIMRARQAGRGRSRQREREADRVPLLVPCNPAIKQHNTG